METNRLRQFCAVVQTSNLRRAAAMLGISHSGLSKSMQALEDELGLTLFLPSGRGLTVSDDGRQLFERCPVFFEEIERLKGANPRRQSDLLRLGSFEVFTSYFIGQLLKTTLASTQIEVHELTPGKLEEALLTHRVDLGITYEPLPRAGVEHVEVTRVEMGVFAAGKTFARASLSDVPFVAPASPIEGVATGVRGSDAWPERLPRVIRYRVDSLTTGIELVRQGLCAIFMPRFVAALHNQTVRSEFTLRPLAWPRNVPLVKRPVCIVKRESTPESKSTREIARALRKMA